MSGSIIKDIFDSMIDKFAGTFIDDIDYKYPTIFSYPLEMWYEKLTDLVTVDLNVTHNSWENFLSNLFNIPPDHYVFDNVTKNTLFRWYLYQDPREKHQLTITFKILTHEFYLSKYENTKCYINFVFFMKSLHSDYWHICEFINIDLNKINIEKKFYNIYTMDSYIPTVYDPKVYSALSGTPISALLADGVCQSLISDVLSDAKREFSFYIPQSEWKMFNRTCAWGMRLFIS